MAKYSFKAGILVGMMIGLGMTLIAIGIAEWVK